MDEKCLTFVGFLFKMRGFGKSDVFTQLADTPPPSPRPLLPHPDGRSDLG